MNLNLAGQRALVGGASRGLGAACARQLAFQGAEVVLLARSADQLAAVVETLSAGQGQQHGYICVDASDIPALSVAVQAEIEEGGPISVWVNNTGGPAPGPAHAAEPGAYAAAFNQHLISSQTLLQLLLPGMREAGFGRIISILSTSVKQPIRNLGVSNTIRAAMANWAKTLASELAADGITVNNVLPGMTRTDRLHGLVSHAVSTTGKTEDEVIRSLLSEVPVRRFAEPEELANAVGFLASPAAAYITGINMPVDGGKTGCL